MAAPIKFGVGQSVLRKEDDALIRGKGRYTDDHSPQPAQHAPMLRSPHAHAKFTIDTSRARGLPGVASILTADDIKEIILQQASYCGVPAGNHAFREAETVLKELGKMP